MKSACIWMLALAATAAGAPAFAQHAPMFAASKLDGVRRLSPEQRQERRFLQDAAAHLRLQNAASTLALARSTNGPVRQLAAALVNHCNATQPEVLHLLHARGMALPMRGNDENRLMKQLGRLSGSKFDRVYLQEVVLRLSEADATQYERILATTQDAQLHAWLERHLATVKYHASLAAHALPAEAPRLARGARRESRYEGSPATRLMGAGPTLIPPPAPPRKAAAPTV
jgi:predicted outer membrane protein